MIDSNPAIISIATVSLVALMGSTVIGILSFHWSDIRECIQTRWRRWLEIIGTFSFGALTHWILIQERQLQRELALQALFVTAIASSLGLVIVFFRLLLSHRRIVELLQNLRGRLQSRAN